MVDGEPRHRSLWPRLALGVVITLLAIAVGNEFLSISTDPQRTTNERSSSFDTGDSGTRAYAELLHHYGYGVERQLGSLNEATLPTDATVVSLDAGTLSRSDAATLLSFAARGGRLVVGDTAPSYLHLLRDAPPVWRSVHREYWHVGTANGFAGIHNVRSAGAGVWTSSGSSEVVVGDDDGSLLTTEHVGAGTILFLADTTPLDNTLIQSVDNAAFALALAGESPRPVIFAEGVHGYAGDSGWAAIPSRWKTALLILLAAAACFAWSRGVRFGPPDQTEREPAPARIAYIDSLAASMDRAHDPAAAARARERVEAALASNVYRTRGDGDT